MFAETKISGSQSRRSHHSLGRIYEEDSVEENQDATAMAFMEGSVEGKNHESFLQEKSIKEGSRTKPDGKMLEARPEKTKSEDPPGRFVGTWDSKKGQIQWQNLGDGLHEVQLDWGPKASSYFPKVKLWSSPATNTCPPTSPQTRVQLPDPHNVPSRIFPLKEPLNLSVHEVGAENLRRGRRDHGVGIDQPSQLLDFQLRENLRGSTILKPVKMGEKGKEQKSLNFNGQRRKGSMELL